MSTFLGGIAGAIFVMCIVFGAVSLGWLALPYEKIQNTQGSITTDEVIDVADIVERSNPAVVSIVITKDVPIIERYYENPFSKFFGGNANPQNLFQIPQYRQNGTEKKDVGGGTGFFVSQDGYIVTNAHVVQDTSAAYTVFTIDEVRHAAEVIAKDEILDVAVLKIDGSDFPFLEFGDSDNIRLGETVIAIGNALAEFRNTVSTGVISGVARSISARNSTGASESLQNVIQTDAAINPGNSGGPLLNIYGKVIGVNVAVASNSENIAFSLPANAVKASVDSIILNGKVVYPYLGVRFVMVTPAIQEANDLDVDYGAIVVRGATQAELAVIPGSPADKAGLVENDIILEIDGVKLEQENSLDRVIRSKKVGDELSLKILHDGEEKIVKATLQERPN